MLQCKDLAPILSLLPGHHISQIIFVRCQCHVGAVLPQQGYLWWLTSMCAESLLWSCCFARTSCCHKSSWKSSSDLNLMEEVWDSPNTASHTAIREGGQLVYKALIWCRKGSCSVGARLTPSHTNLLIKNSWGCLGACLHPWGFTLPAGKGISSPGFLTRAPQNSNV